MKRTIQVLVLVLLAAMVFPATVSAADVYTEGYFKYRVEKDSVTICDYFGKESEVTVPARIVGNPVSKIAKGAFDDNSKVKKVNLPDTIMSIEEGAFAAGIRIVYDSNTKNPVTSAAGTGSGSKSEGTKNSKDGQSAVKNNSEKNGSSAGSGSNSDAKSGSGSDSKSGSKAGKSANDSQPGIEEMEAELDDEEIENITDSGSFTNKIKAYTEEKGWGVVIAAVAVIVLVLCAVGVYIWKKKKNK